MKQRGIEQTMKSTLIIRIAVTLALLTACVQAVAYGQSMANYGPPTSSSITYSTIEFLGSAIYSWRNVGLSTEDDNRSFPVPIGFDFYYCGERYTTFCVSTNGFIDFSTSTRDGGPGQGTRQYWAFGPYDDDLSTSSRSAPSGDAGTVLGIAPFYYDLTTQGELDPLGGSIKYLVTGTAPNRILTVEWIRMAIWTNTTPNFNFQLKLYESTGKIQFLYSTMTLGTFDFAASPTLGYTIGMSGPTLASNPTAAQALIQQTANTTTFNNTRQNDLRIVPTNNTMLTFQPPVPAAPTAFSVNGISTTGMTLHWTDNATNEIGYVVYRSDDGGSTYNFVRKLAAGVTSSVETNLVPAVTYYWRVYAVTEGALSTPLSGSATTLSPSAFVSTRTGPWSTPNTWVGNIVPTAFSIVTIANGTTVTIDQNIQVSDLTIGQGTSGTLLIGSNTTVRTVTIVGNLDIKIGATFKPNAYTATHTMTMSGNLTNAGTFDMAPAAGQVCNVTFNKQGNQAVSGTGAMARFNLMTLNMGASASNILDVSATNFSAVSNFLTLVNGTFNLAAPAAIVPFTSANTIPITAGLTLNNTSAVVTTTGGSLNVNGDLAVHSGSLIVGNAADQDLISYGGRFIFDGGTVTVAGGFMPKDNYTITDFTLANAAVVTLNKMGCTSTTYAPFTISVSGSKFTQTGGTLIIQQKGGATGNDNLAYTNYFYSVYTVSGGTLQLGNASTPAGQTMRIKSSIPVYNMTLFNGNVTAILDTYPLTVNNNVTITGGTLNSNALDMTIGGNWTSTGTGTFVPTTAGVTFASSGAQTLASAAALGETFNRLTVNMGAGTLSMNSSASVASTFALSSGTLAVGVNTLTLNGAVSSAGTLTSGLTGTVSYNQAADNQTVILANYGNLSFSNSVKLLPATGVVGIAGSFSSLMVSGHTIAGSTVAFNGSGAQSISPFTFNNLQLVTGGTKTFTAGTDSVKGSFTIASGVTATTTATIVVTNNISHAGTHNGTGSITLAGGTATHALTGAGTYGNLVVNDALGATISNDLVITGQLTLTNGVITPTASQQVIINTATGVTHTGGWVNGMMKRAVAAGASAVAFDIGDAAKYTPATVTFNNVTGATGTLTAKTTTGDHPQISGSLIDPTNSVNRYWTLTPSGLAFDSCRIDFAWINPSDEDVSGFEQLYIAGRYASSVWDTVHVDTRTISAIRAVQVQSFGDFIVGFNGSSNAYRTKGAGAGNGSWNATTIWQYNNVQTNAWRDTTAYPVAAKAGLITIQTGDAVTIPIPVTVDQTIVQSGATLTIVSGGTLTIQDGTGTDLTVAGVLRNTGNDIVQSGSTVAFLSGASYQHAIAGGTIPTAVWDSTSTCEVQGSTTTAPANCGQSFGNFVWNCAAQSSLISLLNAPSFVAGRYTVAASGTGTLQLFGSGINQTLTVKKSFAVSGGSVIGITSTGTSNGIINVSDSLVVSGGSLVLSTTNGDRTSINVAGSTAVTAGTLNLSASSSTDVVTVTKNFTHTGGTISVTGSGRGSIVFNGTAAQTYTSGGSVTGAVDYTVNAGAYLVMGTSVLSGSGAFTLANTGTLSLGSPLGIASSGATGNILVSGTRTFGTGAYYIYNGTSAQVTGNGLPQIVSTLTINNSAGASLSDSVTVADTLSLVNGVFNVQGFTLRLNNIAKLTSGTLSSSAAGTVVYNRASDGQPVIQAAYGNLMFSDFKKTLPSAVVMIAGTFSPGAATGHTIAGSTINYTSAAAQTIAGFIYNNLTMSGAGSKTLSAFKIKSTGLDCTVNGDLTLSAGTFADSGYTMAVKGNIVNSAAHTSIGQGKISLTAGSVAHTLSGTGSYANLDLNDGLGAVLTGNNLNITGILSLTVGVLATGTNSVVVGTAGSITRASNGTILRHIFGTITKPVPVTAGTYALSFETGDAANYTPIDLVFNTITTAGTVTARAVAGAHPSIGASGIDPANCANRYWSLANTGTVFTSYSIDLWFVAADVTPSGGQTSAYFMERLFASAWTPPTIFSRGSYDIRATGLTEVGDFVTGEFTTKFHWSGLSHTFLWNDANNWNLKNIPTAANDVVLDVANADSINVNIAAVCRNLDITEATVILTILPSQSLTVGGSMTMSAGRVNTQNLLPAVTGTKTITGGTIGFTAAGAQTVVSWPYYNLLVGGGNTKTAAVALTVNNFTVAGGTTFADAGFILTAKGNVDNNGIHSGTSEIALASGTAQHQLSGAGTYRIIELNDANGVLLTSSVQTPVLTMTLGTLNTGAYTITVTASTGRTGNGLIIGTITRTHTFTASTPYAFEGPNNLITFNSGGTLPSSVTETTTLASPGANSFMDPINRYYTLSMTGATGATFSYRLHYENGEIAPPNYKGTLKLWRESSPNVWDRRGVTTADSTTSGAYFVELAGISVADMGRWSLSSRTIPNMQITLTPDKLNPAPGDVVTYTISWQNTGDGNAGNTLFSAFVPANTSFVPGSVYYDSIQQPGISAVGTNITFSIGAIAPARTGTITYQVKIN